VNIPRLFKNPTRDLNFIFSHKVPARESSWHPLQFSINTRTSSPKFPSFLSIEFASLLRRSFATVTTARAPACRECPGSHAQYLLLLKSTVTHLVQRVPDRKDTLCHGIGACLEKNWTIRLHNVFGWENDLPSGLKQRGGSFVLDSGMEQLYPNSLYHGSAIICPTPVG